MPFCFLFRILSNGSVADGEWWCGAVAPEVIEMQKPNTTACDIWSLGCTIIELVTGFPPYFDSPAMTALFKMVSEPRPPLPDDITDV
jgi:serine/threonine protein kinase